MKDRITAFIAIVLLASLAGVSYWYSQTTRFKKIAAPVSREGPDFVAHGVTMTQFDETGRATNRLHAGEVMHFAADDHSELSQPRLISLRPGQPLLEARAKNATVEGGGERVLFVRRRRGYPRARKRRRTADAIANTTADGDSGSRSLLD